MRYNDDTFIELRIKTRFIRELIPARVERANYANALLCVASSPCFNLHQQSY